jgi:transposase
MDVVHGCCCGLDVHKQSVVACLMRTVTAGMRTTETRTFATTTDALTELAGWLSAQGCTHAVMESTGVYWKPVFNILREQAPRLDVAVVNAQQVKALRGRKTDVQDAEWLAVLLQHDLLRPSFIPSREQRDPRDLTRTRTTLIDERSAVVNRLHKVLEDANIKLAGVATDVMGVSGRAMLAALVDGSVDAAAMAELARGKLRTKRAELERALAGRMREHHRALVAMHLSHVDVLDEQIADLDEWIVQQTRPVAEAIARLDTIPGVDVRTAQVLVAEVGVQMAQFPTAKHLASWAGMAPGNNQSAGKRRDGTTRKGSTWLRRALVQSARAAARTKKAGQTAFAEQYRRLVVRLGPKQAAVAVGRAILITAYHVLAHRTTYTTPMPIPLDDTRRRRLERRALAQLGALGYHVTLAPKEPAA